MWSARRAPRSANWKMHKRGARRRRAVALTRGAWQGEVCGTGGLRPYPLLCHNNCKRILTDHVIAMQADIDFGNPTPKSRSRPKVDEIEVDEGVMRKRFEQGNTAVWHTWCAGATPPTSYLYAARRSSPRTGAVCRPAGAQCPADVQNRLIRCPLTICTAEYLGAYERSPCVPHETSERSPRLSFATRTFALGRPTRYCVFPYNPSELITV